MITNFLSKQSKMYSQLVNDIHIKESWQAMKDFNWHEYYEDMKDKLKDLPRTNYQLALYHLNAGHLNDARLRFRIANYLDKGNTYTDTNYYIGLCYYEQFKYDKAEKYLKEHLTQQTPSHTEEANFCLKVITNRSSEITRVPASLIAYKFDQLLTLYGTTSISNSHRASQEQMVRQVNSYLQLNSKPFGNNVLDLGCGTGTLGTLVRELKLASFVVGIDVSQSMLTATKNALVDGVTVYNSTINTSITDYLPTITDSSTFDIIFAADSLGSIAQIDATLSQLAKLLSPKGVVALSFRTTEHEAPEFNPYAQQFMLTPGYLARSAATAKLKVYSQEDTTLSNGDAGALILLVKE